MRGEQLQHLGPCPAFPGSPPRARGAGPPRRRRTPPCGITPACAGSSPGSAPHPGHAPDHPRVRGEQLKVRSPRLWSAGSPPRARGAGEGFSIITDCERITPACAGSRASRRTWRPGPTDHPRVRGEQRGPAGAGDQADGSPPRARGADAERAPGGRGPGITPACAGSRVCHHHQAKQYRDHPRVRGEQLSPGQWRTIEEGSPPRARGAGPRRAERPPAAGITPACAGSSSGVRGWRRCGRDHPRVRGEQMAAETGQTADVGSPPRARGAVPADPDQRDEGGITPACAGSRTAIRSTSTTSRDHPRVRGEQTSCPDSPASSTGSPPRARGADPEPRTGSQVDGITPACAGSSEVVNNRATGRADHPRVRGEQTS